MQIIFYFLLILGLVLSMLGILNLLSSKNPSKEFKNKSIGMAIIGIVLFGIALLIHTKIK